MKLPKVLALLLATVIFPFFDLCAVRVVEDFNFNWEFHLGETEEGRVPDEHSAEWRTVRLPHDWSVELSFTEVETAGATAFLPGGIGWYQKQFHVPEKAKGRITWIEFDGVYSNSDVWINGHHLGHRPYGYIPFSYDLTKHLNYGEENTITVRADRSAFVDCRWYPGSGIYRNVKLVTAHSTHIPQWGVFVTTPIVSDANAYVEIQTTLRGENEPQSTLELRSRIVKNGETVASQSTPIEFEIDEKSETQLLQSIKVNHPERWDIDNPQMYSVVSEVLLDGVIIDRKETSFGFRTFRFDKDRGFFLNGRNLLLKGVCLHHDGGLVGAAVPDGVWERRLLKLKAAGCNAIRTAHNPPSEAFLDLCDRLGFLVQDEAFDEWNNPKDKRNNYSQAKEEEVTRGYTEHFSEWSERDLKAMVMRDRNHPSIIMWSIGNEIEWTYPRYQYAPGYWGDLKVGDASYYWEEPPYEVDQIKEHFYSQPETEHVLHKTAQDLSKWVKQIDTTRLVTANVVIPSVSNFSGFSDALDIVGLSYRQSVYDYCKRHYPDMVFLGTENWTRYHEWEPVLEKEFISGIFLWTGINYMGESREWPKRGSNSGLLDFAGFEKPAYHLFKSLWSEEPHIFLTTQVLEQSPYKWNESDGNLDEKEEQWAARQKWGWQDVNEHWNYQAGDEIAVEVYTNQKAVELFLNGTSLGTQRLEDVSDHILKWKVPFASGELIAKAVDTRAETSIATAQSLAKLKIESDRDELTANAYDVAHIVVQLLDAAGTPICHADKEVVFEVDGDATILGVDNGNAYSVQDYQANKVVTANGRCLMILQSNRTRGTLKIRARCDEVVSREIVIQVK